MTKVQFGLDTFGDIPRDLIINEQPDYPQAIRQVVKEAKLAEAVGVDIIALGEHHRFDYAISSPEVVLAAIASVTNKITLGSAVTVLSSDDPVRVFERFATVDALANGRAQVMLGRGSFTESFPLFGYDLADYDQLFEEKVNLFSELLKEKETTWTGQLRPALSGANIFPKTQHGLSTWIGVGGSPESIIRAARYELPVMLAVISGTPKRFAPYIELAKQAAAKFQTQPQPIGIHLHGVIATDQAQAETVAWYSIKAMMDQLGRERGWSAMSKAQFDREIKTGSMYVGTPQIVAKKIAKVIKTLNLARFDLVYGAGNQSIAQREATIRLYGEEVIPLVKEMLAE